MSHTQSTRQTGAIAGGRVEVHPMRRCVVAQRLVGSSKTCGFSSGDWTRRSEYTPAPVCRGPAVGSVIGQQCMASLFPFHFIISTLLRNIFLRHGEIGHGQTKITYFTFNFPPKKILQGCWQPRPDQIGSAVRMFEGFLDLQVMNAKENVSFFLFFSLSLLVWFLCFSVSSSVS